MDGVDDVLGLQSQPHGKHALGDKVAGMRPHDVHAQDFAVAGLTNHLDHAGRLAHGHSTTAGDEGKLAHFVRNPIIFGFLLGHADARYLGLSKDTGWHGVVIGFAGAPERIFNGYLSFIRRHMRQHVLAQDIADGVNVSDVRLKVFVHSDSSPGHLHTEPGQV